MTRSETNITDDELKRRADLIINTYSGISPPFEAFYILSILYSASRARSAFERFEQAEGGSATNQDQVSLVHEALGHAAALSRFFWPSKLGGHKRQVFNSLKDARGLRLRRAFELSDHSPLKSRRLRDLLEHFDERLDQYLLRHDRGYFFPDAIVGDSGLADDDTGYLFKLVDRTASCFVILGEKHLFDGIRREVYRIYDRAREFDKVGCRFPS